MEASPIPLTPPTPRPDPPAPARAPVDDPKPDAPRRRRAAPVHPVFLSLAATVVLVGTLGAPFVIEAHRLSLAWWVLAATAALLMLASAASLFVLARRRRNRHEPPLQRPGPEPLDFDEPWKQEARN